MSSIQNQPIQNNQQSLTLPTYESLFAPPQYQYNLVYTYTTYQPINDSYNPNKCCCVLL